MFSPRHYVRTVMAQEYTKEDFKKIWDSFIKGYFDTVDQLYTEINQEVNKVTKADGDAVILAAKGIKSLIDEGHGHLDELETFFSKRSAAADIASIFTKKLPEIHTNLQNIIKALEKNLSDDNMPGKWKKVFQHVYMMLNQDVERLSNDTIKIKKQFDMAKSKGQDRQDVSETDVADIDKALDEGLKQMTSSIVRRASTKHAAEDEQTAAGVVQDDRTDKGQPFGFVIMVDTFMSGWGDAPSRSYYAIAVGNQEEADLVTDNAKKRSEMRNIRLRKVLPHIGAGDHLHVTDKSKATWFFEAH